MQQQRLQTGNRPAGAHKGVPSYLRRRALSVSAASHSSDRAARVRGDVRRVYKYVSDFGHLAAWYPDVIDVQRTRGNSDIAINSRFSVLRKVSSFQLQCQYEVADMDANKRIVYTAGSNVHSASHQLLFMPDPMDPLGYTNIRYIKKVQLRSHFALLGPIANGWLAHHHETALKNLSSLLASSSTPLRHVVVEEEHSAHVRSPHAAWPNRPSFNINSLLDGWGFGGGSGGGGSGTRRVSTRGGNTAVATRPVDSLGFYRLLGLDKQVASTVQAEHIKTAYRKAAQLYHPDKFTSFGPEARKEADATFQKLQKAYSVLRDADKKAMYDAGKIHEDFIV